MLGAEMGGWVGAAGGASRGSLKEDEFSEEVGFPEDGVASVDIGSAETRTGAAVGETVSGAVMMVGIGSEVVTGADTGDTGSGPTEGGVSVAGVCGVVVFGSICFLR